MAAAAVVAATATSTLIVEENPLDSNIDYVLAQYYKRQEINDARKEELFKRVLDSLGDFHTHTHKQI